MCWLSKNEILYCYLPKKNYLNKHIHLSCGLCQQGLVVCVFLGSAQSIPVYTTIHNSPALNADMFLFLRLGP